jgi:hypothetical protein
MISALFLGGFLFFTYRIIRTEVEANYFYENDQPSQIQSEKCTVPASSSETEAALPMGKTQSDKASKPRKSDEGSRREWYKKRSRRWFTPPEQEHDKGLPKTRSRFKVA